MIEIDRAEDRTTAVSLSADGELLVVGFTSGALEVWRPESGSERRFFPTAILQKSSPST